MCSLVMIGSCHNLLLPPNVAMDGMVHLITRTFVAQKSLCESGYPGVVHSGGGNIP